MVIKFLLLSGLSNGLLAYYTSTNNVLDKQWNSLWSGSIVGGATVNAINGSYRVVADSGFFCDGIAEMNFEYDRSICTPRLVQFSTSLPDIQSFEWSFGNGQISNSPNPSVEYSNYSEYTVKLKVKNLAGCEDSISKTIAVGLQTDDIIVTLDTTICAGDSFQLRTITSALGVCWQPAEGLSSSSIPNPVAKPSVSTTYHITSQVRGGNLVVNGDFSDGNVGFISDYTYASSGIPAAVYTVAADPSSWHPAMPPCQDHTTGTGNMMMVNGSEQLNSVVWSETISVMPETEYVFSAWLETITTVNPAQLQFSINGKTIGNIFSANSASCKWDQFYTTWKSESNTVATISIINMNQGFSGNDFALDDIFFGELSLKTETVKVTVASLPTLNVGADTSVCKGATVQLHANSTAHDQITWSPALFLNNANIPNPVASPLSNVTYAATAKNISGCYKTDTISINVGEINVAVLQNDTSVCVNSSLPLSVSGADSFKWFPSAGLSNAGISNPVASIDSSITYIVTGTTTEGCTANDTVNITALLNPVIIASKDTTFCGPGLVQLAVNGGSKYQWSPAAGLDNANKPSPVARVDSSVEYIVTGTADNGCSAFDTVRLTVLSKPIRVVSADTSICGSDSIQLFASGGDSYHWFPASGLSSSSIAKPVAKIDSSITYAVTVVSNNGCSAVDSTTIVLLNKPVLTVAPDTTVCSGSSVTLAAAGAYQYNWTPASGLSDPNTAKPVAQASSSQTYTLAAVSEDGCTAFDSIHITVLPIPVVSVSGDTSICSNSTVQLYAAGGVEYEWFPPRSLDNPSIDRPVATPTEEVTYIVTVTGANKCITQDSLKVAVKSTGDFSIKSSADQICAGSSVQFTASGGDVYKWQPVSDFVNSNISNPFVRPVTNTTYSVYIKDSMCNRDTVLTLPLTINPLPKVFVTKENDITCSNPSVQLKATGGKEYRWSPSTGLNNALIANPVATISASTTFHVTATSEQGCEASDSLRVNFINSGSSMSWGLPTAFTPNGDGLNDCFGVQRFGAFQVLQMNIYNRWGQLVFNGTNSSDCWDGTFKGMPQQTGVFPYILTAETSCGMIEKKGTVLLIR